MLSSQLVLFAHRPALSKKKLGPHLIPFINFVPIKCVLHVLQR